MTVRTQDDHSHGKRHWVGAVPSLVYKFSKTYWKSTGLVPPYDTEFAPDPNATVSYTPLGNMGHRTNIDGGAGYAGRGMLTRYDVRAFMNQAALDGRVVRTNAFAGLHLPYHFRDERTRTRSGESADIANTLMPQLWWPKADSASTFTGLPTPRHAYRKVNAIEESYRAGYVDPQGGSGVWSPGGDASHASAFCTYAYLLEGERYMLESVIDHATFIVSNQNPNSFDGLPPVHWWFDTTARAEMSIPGTLWSAIPDMATGQERSLGFSANLLGHAAALTPDNDPQGPYLRGWNSHCGEYLAAGLATTPPSALAGGWTYLSIGTMRSPWMTNLIVQGCYGNAAMTEVSDFASYGNMAVKSTAALFNRSRSDAGAERSVSNAINAGYNLTTNPFFPVDGALTIHPTTCTSNVLTWGHYYGPQAGEVVYFLTFNSGYGAVALPAGFTAGTPYYVINPTSTTYQIAATPGGAVVSVPNGSYSVGGRWLGGSAVSVAAPPAYPPQGGDQYWSLAMAAFAYAERAGSTNVPAGAAAAMKAFLANEDRTDTPVWEMSV